MKFSRSRRLNNKRKRKRLSRGKAIKNKVARPINLQYSDWEKRLVKDPEIMAGETVFPNSRLTVRRVAALLERGESKAVILEDYPYLKPMDLEFAKVYSQRDSRVRTC